MSNVAGAIGDANRTNFRIGKVFSSTFNVLSGGFFSFITVGIIANAPFILYFFLFPPETMEEYGRNSSIATFIYLIIYPLATAIIVHGAFQHMRGGNVNMVASVASALGRLLPLIGLSILWTLGVTLGFILLIIPGLIVLVMWCVIVPCCVVEKTGPIRSFGRSRELTKGVRWKIFAIFLVAFLMTTLLSIGGNALFGIYGYFGDLQQQFQLQRDLQASWIYIAYSLVFSGIYLAFYSVLVVVTYYHLRQHKEGVDIDAIASVFD